jgi:hypothetical protein
MNNPDCTLDRTITSALYLYGVTEAARDLPGTLHMKKGIEIRTIVQAGLAALVRPSDDSLEDLSQGAKAIEALLQSHEEVLEEIEGNYGTVVPACFGILVKGEEELREWLARNHESLSRKLHHIKGKKEYGIKIYLHVSALGSSIICHDPEFCRLEAEIHSQSPGRAYLSRQKLQSMVKGRIERTCDELFKSYFQKISSVVQDLAVKKVAADHHSPPMLMNLSVLADDTARTALGEVLDEINGGALCDVAFTGPWLPFSFAETVDKET